MSKERPILFSTQMVQAILEGRKTQTRRILNCDHPVVTGFIPNGPYYWQGTAISKAVEQQYISTFPRVVKCPFGAVGDILWVRETFGTKIRNVGGTPHESFAYKADNPNEIAHLDCNGNGFSVKWKPSIHMPRSASRILLEITNIRVERLNDISEADAVAEGCIADPCDHARRTCDEIGCCGPTATGHFKYVWESINGPESWNKNPWVWCITFKVIEGGAA